MSHPMIGMFLYTQIHNCNTKLGFCSMAMRGRINVALSTVLLSEAFSGVPGNVVQGPKTAGRAVSASYESHVPAM